VYCVGRGVRIRQGKVETSDENKEGQIDVMFTNMYHIIIHLARRWVFMQYIELPKEKDGERAKMKREQRRTVKSLWYISQNLREVKAKHVK